MNQLYVISYYIKDLLSLVVGGRKQGTFFRVLLRATHSSCLLLPSFAYYCLSDDKYVPAYVIVTE